MIWRSHEITVLNFAYWKILLPLGIIGNMEIVVTGKSIETTVKLLGTWSEIEIITTDYSP